MEKDGFSMSIISEVKCARCDRNYSGVRSRCPYCGARRIGSGKYSEGGDNSKGKMLIGVLILAVLVVAAAVLLFTTQRPEEEPSPIVEISDTPSSELPDDTDNTSLPGIAPSVEPSESPTESEPVETSTPPPKVESVVITYSGVVKTDFTGVVAEKVPLRVKVEPAGVEFDEKIVWKSSDTTVFEVVEDNLDGTAATVIIVGSGSAKSALLTVSIGGVEAECVVRVK